MKTKAVKLSKRGLSALKFLAGGYATVGFHGSISRATAGVLQRKGLIKVEWVSFSNGIDGTRGFNKATITVAGLAAIK